MTDVRKAVSASRPSATRRTTPQSAQKLGRNPRDRERELEDELWWDEERESFPNYCMICEKQFVSSSDDRFLYCSEACRLHDQQTSSDGASFPSRYSSTQYTATIPLYSPLQEPRDIIPRASPSRPSSMHFSSPIMPETTHTSAISALKSSLAARPPSPASPVGSYHPRMWPFGQSTATSPNNSYSKPVSSYFPSTYDGAYYVGGLYGASSDRPLPTRKPGMYSRPKSIELVTPLVSR